MTAHAGLTRNQSLVLGVLEKTEAPMSAYAILDELREDGLRAPLQVYRALEKLLDMGLAHRLESLNAFVVCSHPHTHESELVAFAICDSCGQVVEFSDDIVHDRLESWAQAQGFKSTRTTMEIRGECSKCA